MKVEIQAGSEPPYASVIEPCMPDDAQLAHVLEILCRLPDRRDSLLDENEARRYRDSLSLRQVLLENLQQRACDPAGAQDNKQIARTHPTLGGAARIIARLLDQPHAKSHEDFDEALARYCASLPGVLPEGVAETGTPVYGSSACGAVVNEVLGDVVQAAEHGDAAEISARLSELLDLLDTLSLDRPIPEILRFVDDYVRTGRAWRSRRLLSTYLRSHPDDAVASAAFARLLLDRRDAHAALKALIRAVELAPADHQLRRTLARHLLNLGRVDESVEHFACLEQQGYLGEKDLSEKTRALAFQRQILQADNDKQAMPWIEPSLAEKAAGRFDAASLNLASKLYRKHGTLQINNIFNAELLETCRLRFLEDNADRLNGDPGEQALQIGDRRFQVSLVLADAFNDPGFYANGFLLGVMRHLLGRQAIIGSTVCATSLPGSRDQHLHKDHRAIFTAHPEDEPMSLPPVAITAMIPLVSLDESVGTTVVKKGSHRCSRSASERLPSQIPIVPLGSCFLMDLSLSHRGQGNTSELVRPIVNMQYQQRWFVDNKNFRVQPPLQIPPDEYTRIPERHRKLFDWAIQPGARVNR